MARQLHVPFGLRNSTLYEPQQVANGKGCNCVCPGCLRPLIARQNHSTPHFAHAPGEDCAKAFETAVHLAAKQVIAKRGVLRLPALEHVPQFSLRIVQTLLAEQTVLVDNVREELWWEDMRPDIVANYQGQSYLVEIAVTHFVDAPKQRKIEAQKLPALEIDVRSLRAHPTFAGLETLLYTTKPYPARWLYHPAFAELERLALEERLITQALQEKEANERKKEQQRKLAEQMDQEARLERYRNLAPAAKLALNAKNLGLTVLQVKKLTAFVPWEKSFGCPREVWQSAVLAYIKKEEAAAEQWIRAGIPAQINHSACLAWLRTTFRIDPQVSNGESIALQKYLRHMETLGILKWLSHREFYLITPSEKWRNIRYPA